MISNIRKTVARTALLALAASAPLAHAGWGDVNLRQGVTEISRQIYGMHMTMFWWCVAIGAFVFGWMIWSLVAFRKSQGAVPDTTMVHSTQAEIIWTLIPVGILVLMAVPAAKALIAIEDTRNTELTIKVTGYQWKWQYEYLDDGVSFFSTLARASDEARQLQSGIDPNGIENYLLDVDNALVVPVDTKVRLLLTSQDVIHAWWVPDFGMKKDAIPGFVNEMWFKVEAGKTGTYRGQCAELCGRDHGFMPIVVKVLSKEDYKAWIAQQKAAAAPAAAPAAEAAAPATASSNSSPASAPAHAST
ncbi:MAG: cytochrome c oxidase subunit II [Steroidobacteraceae bacterium]